MSGPAPDVKTVAKVDLDRYLGRWNVISHTPYVLEKGKVATFDYYARRPDGRMDNIFNFRKGSLDAPEEHWNGVAWVANHETNADWKVQFIWPFTAHYLVLELDPDYRWSVVSTGDGGLVWVLARDLSLPEATYQDLLKRIARRGLNADNLEKVLQPAK